MIDQPNLQPDKSTNPFDLDSKKTGNGIILFIGSNSIDICDQLIDLNYRGLSLPNFSKSELWLNNQILSNAEMPIAIIADFALSDGDVFTFFNRIKYNKHLRNIPFIVAANNRTREDKIKALKIGIDDFYINRLNAEQVHQRIQFLYTFKKTNVTNELEPEIQLNHFIPVFRMPVMKRLFDFSFSLLALIVLSPLFLLIAVLIAIESRGPVFYISLRAGSGYKVFNFYKFRTMKADADKELDHVLHLNKYGNRTGTSFVKIDKDPRITKVGKILRRLSLDELPQLINVLIGDMSLVGNRPLPLYEAEKLTKDQFAKRFLAPAGITGLWQVSRGHMDQLSEDERMKLDIAYADNSSFAFDMRILLKTIPVILHHEEVR